MKKFILTAVALTAFIPHLAAVDLITVNFSGEVSAQEQQVFLDAASFWNSTITGYKANFDGVGAPVTHSLVITASTPALDGVGGTLGQAGPVSLQYADNNPLGTPTYARYYSKTGTMQFDSADTASLVANGTFFGVVLHEMGHVLGLGTLWETNTSVDPGFGNLYTPSGPTGTFNGETVGMYTGAFALAKWQTEFTQPGATFVPIEKGGGAGTANGHWNELDGGGIAIGPVSAISGLDLSKELMTGWASDTFYLSTVTLGSLEDLGYDVDYSKAGIIGVPEPSAYLTTLSLGLILLASRRRKNVPRIPRR